MADWDQDRQAGFNWSSLSSYNRDDVPNKDAFDYGRKQAKEAHDRIANLGSGLWDNNSGQSSTPAEVPAEAGPGLILMAEAMFFQYLVWHFGCYGFLQDVTACAVHGKDTLHKFGVFFFEGLLLTFVYLFLCAKWRMINWGGCLLSLAGLLWLVFPKEGLTADNYWHFGLWALIGAGALYGTHRMISRI